MAAENHVENPFEYVIEKLTWAASDVSKSVLPNPVRHASQAVPVVRKITVADLWDALKKGVADVAATRDDILFIGIIYPLAGLLLAELALHYDMLPLVFPLASGFALIGPFAAIGLYELSRRRERGDHVTWLDAFGVLRSPALATVLGLGAIQLALFAAWLMVAYEIFLLTLGGQQAYEIFLLTLGGQPPRSLAGFERDLFTTSGGWTMIVAGLGVGFLFAVLAFAISVVSFPLLLDRDVGVARAIGASLRTVAANPGVMMVWGLIVAGALVLGSLPALVGLIFVVPMLGHATWHLYRKVIA